MRLFVGLGNPDHQYKENRHNIGFMVVDAIADEYGFPPFKSKFQGQISEGLIAGQKIILLKPQTYMNNSGQSVKAAAHFFKIPPAHIIVFHDELDVAPGKVKIKQGGGNAGHNGLKSIQAHLGTADFWRVRMGIGHPGDKSRVHSYVLSDFAKAEQEWLKPLLESCARQAGLLLKGDLSGFIEKVTVT
ncbi:MAG: aminoacyl-tRNA hydrolase [Alphaproteobacteria bacterium CG_4_9_14_3_um_filter_47_13]|nr:MAG: aminoacyl-tRNA hydrolase [Alphaproteobacteria bacterium CG_4_9_14_3_um_filter_47_13]